MPKTQKMTFNEFMHKMLEAFPDATTEEDNDGQIVIYTGLKTSMKDDVEMVVPFEPSEG